MAAGADALLARLKQIQDSARASARPCAEAMAAAGERAIKLKLSLSSHPPGTKTPSPPGSPPSLITGRLRQSVRLTKIYPSGLDQWTAHVAPTTVYARIQELGGTTGKGHHSNLPSRPYVRPAIRDNEDKIKDAAVEVFRRYTKT